VIAGSPFLAKEAQKHTAHCRVLPSAVETRNIPLKNYEVNNPKFVIGWVGNETNLICLKELTPVFQKLAKKHEIQVRIISSKAIEIPGVETRFIPWDVNTQESEIAQFDVGVMPLHDYPHSRGKCAYKALQYMAAGVPPVVSSVGVNSEVVEHGVCGYVVPELKDFDVFIEKLIMDRASVARMGAAARIKVTEQFSIECVGRALAELLAC
jgi:glycosyltransferase involved in cell wall biosynthesis